MKTMAADKTDVRKKDARSHGSCRFNHTAPDMKERELSSLNIAMSFQDALRLSTAIQSAVMSLNRNDQRSSGKKWGLLLSVKQKNSTITVLETKLRKPSVK